MSDEDYPVVNLCAEGLYDVEVYGTASDDLEDVEEVASRVADKAKQDSLDAKKNADEKGLY